jgi:putative alpha-1,2-mannosidase
MKFRFVRWNMKYRYTTDPDGLPGNDDYGTMSAWYTFGAIGFYPLAGSTQYMIGSPLFDKLIIHRTEGDLIIIANDASEQNIYVASVTVNGNPIDLTNPFLFHDQIAGETTIIFQMSAKPSLI